MVWCARRCARVGGSAVGRPRFGGPDLHRLASWTNDVRELVVFPQDDYPDRAGSHDYTRAVLSAEPSSPRRRTRPRSTGSRFALACVAVVTALGIVSGVSAETWRGLTVASEHRCSDYDKKRDYPYPQSVERDIVGELGAVYGPYTGTCFASTRETDIEHIVAASEAHDSGLCVADAATKARFSRDLRNLTLASPRVNRHEKSGRDAAEWLPARNRCWFAWRVVEVRRAYALTIDRREAAAVSGYSPGARHGARPRGVRGAHRLGAARFRTRAMRWRSTTERGTAESPAAEAAENGLRRCRGRSRYRT